MITKRELIADIYNLIAATTGVTGSLFQASNSVVDYLDRNGLLQGVEGIGTAPTTPEAPEAATGEPRKPQMPRLQPHPVLGAGDVEVVELGQCERCLKWSQLFELSVVQRHNRQVLTWEHRAPDCDAYVNLLPPHYDHLPTHDPRKSFAYRVPIREIEEMFK